MWIWKAQFASKCSKSILLTAQISEALIICYLSWRERCKLLLVSLTICYAASLNLVRKELNVSVGLRLIDLSHFHCWLTLWLAYLPLCLQGFKENLHAVFCLAENAIGPGATRPDDVHVLYSGKLVFQCSVCACMSGCVCAQVRACVRACACACVWLQCFVRCYSNSHWW